jgi:hypothetical protein
MEGDPDATQRSQKKDEETNLFQIQMEQADAPPRRNLSQTAQQGRGEHGTQQSFCLFAHAACTSTTRLSVSC